MQIQEGTEAVPYREDGGVKVMGDTYWNGSLLITPS